MAAVTKALFLNIQVLSDTVKFLWIREPASEKLYAVPQEFVAALTPIVSSQDEQQAPGKGTVELPQKD